MSKVEAGAESDPYSINAGDEQTALLSGDYNEEARQS